MEEIGAALGSLLIQDMIQDSTSPLERSSLLTQDDLCPRKKGLATAATVVNQYTENTNPFYMENLST
jgi:hypothetical protein